MQTEVVLPLKALVLGLAFAGLVSSAAMALSVTKTVGAADHSSINKVDYARDHRGHDHRGYKHRRYRAGGRYDRAPGNWHRYDRRPGDWQRRGCIIVGPVWWCP
jgi:hypothetical protein